MTDQEVFLELGRLVARDDRGGEVPKAGRDAVHDRPIGDQGGNHVASFLHALAGMDVQQRWDIAAGNGFDIRDGQIRARQDDRRVVTGRTRSLGRIEVRSVRGGHGSEDSRLCSRPCSTS